MLFMEIQLQSGLSSITIAAASHITQHSSLSVIMKLFLALQNKGKISCFFNTFSSYKIWVVIQCQHGVEIPHYQL